MKLTESLKTLFTTTAATLKGSSRRVFMARSVQELGRGGQALAMRDLGWSEWSILKGRHELASGLVCVDAFHLRGRRPVRRTCPHCWTILGRLSMAKARRTRSFAPSACTPGSRARKCVAS